jgi:hypothetical protein
MAAYKLFATYTLLATAPITCTLFSPRTNKRVGVSSIQWRERRVSKRSFTRNGSLKTWTNRVVVDSKYPDLITRTQTDRAMAIVHHYRTCQSFTYITHKAKFLLDSSVQLHRCCSRVSG